MTSDLDYLRRKFLGNDYAESTKPSVNDWPFADTNQIGHKGKMMNALSNLGGDKFLNRLFRKADGVVWDLMTGKVGISTKEGIATLVGEGEDAQIEINMIEQFGMEVPAFAQSTPIESVNVGDVIYFGATEKPGWVIGKKVSGGSAAKAKSRTAPAVAAEEGKTVGFQLMKVDGQRTSWTPPKVSMLGMGDAGVMVLRSLLTMLPNGSQGLNGIQNNIGMMMQMQLMSGGDTKLDLEGMLPLMLMGQMNGDAAGGNNMMQTMLMMKMMGGLGGNGNKGGSFFNKG